MLFTQASLDLLSSLKNQFDTEVILNSGVSGNAQAAAWRPAAGASTGHTAPAAAAPHRAARTAVAFRTARTALPAADWLVTCNPSAPATTTTQHS